MSGCKHEKSWRITEVGTAFTLHDFEEGELSHWNDFGNLTGIAVFTCRDCGYTVRFNTSKIRRKWLADRFQSAIAGGAE